MILERPPRETVRTIDVEAFDFLPDGVLLVRRGRVAWASHRAAELFGSTPDALSGRPLGALFDAHDLAGLDALLGLRQGAKAASGLVRMRIRDDGSGEARDLEVRAAPAGGSLLPAAILTLRDASPQRRTERIVRELSEVVASTDSAEPEALLSAAEPIFEALHWSGAYWEVTRQGARLLRLLAPRTHLFGGIEDRVPGEEVSFDRAPLLEAVVTSGTSRFFRESHAMPTCGACVPIRRGGRVTHVLTVVGADVGERDVVAVELLADQIAASLGRAEQQRALLERERLAAWGGFASEIAEEMRDSFAALVLASDRLAFPRTEAPEADPLEAVKSGTAKLRHVVDGLLRLAEPVVARMEVVGLRDVLLRAVAGADDLGRHDAEAVELETTADLPPVRADADLLRQAIEILLSERLHRGPADGRVAVRAEPEGPGVRISVEGTGPTSPTGLRVAVVRRSVEEMGGRFAIESSDRGASFSIWLRTEASEAGAP